MRVVTVASEMTEAKAAWMSSRSTSSRARPICVMKRQRSAASKLRYSADDPETAEQREQYAACHSAATTARLGGLQQVQHTAEFWRA